MPSRPARRAGSCEQCYSRRIAFRFRATMWSLAGSGLFHEFAQAVLDDLEQRHEMTETGVGQPGFNDAQGLLVEPHNVNVIWRGAGGEQVVRDHEVGVGEDSDKGLEFGGGAIRSEKVVFQKLPL